MPTPMSSAAASRIQSSTAKNTQNSGHKPLGGVQKGSFAARAQSAAASNANAGRVQSQPTAPQSMRSTTNTEASKTN